jgi:hypothetical protein
MALAAQFHPLPRDSLAAQERGSRRLRRPRPRPTGLKSASGNYASALFPSFCVFSGLNRQAHGDLSNLSDVLVQPVMSAAKHSAANRRHPFRMILSIGHHTISAGRSTNIFMIAIPFVLVFFACEQRLAELY